MSDIKQLADSNATDFKRVVEAGQNSCENTKNCQAGSESSQELKNEVVNKDPLSESRFKEPSPLFLIESSDGKKGNAQDEKDEMEE